MANRPRFPLMIVALNVYSLSKLSKILRQSYCSLRVLRLKRKYNVLQIIIPNADVPLSTTAKIGMIGVLRISPRRTTASGPAKSIVSAGRQSPLELEIISMLNNPNHGASRNHPTSSGMKVVNMRGKKEIEVSP